MLGKQCAKRGYWRARRGNRLRASTTTNARSSSKQALLKGVSALATVVAVFGVEDEDGVGEGVEEFA